MRTFSLPALLVLAATAFASDAAGQKVSIGRGKGDLEGAVIFTAPKGLFVKAGPDATPVEVGSGGAGVDELLEDVQNLKDTFDNNGIKREKRDETDETDGDGDSGSSEEPGLAEVVDNLATIVDQNWKSAYQAAYYGCNRDGVPTEPAPTGTFTTLHFFGRNLIERIGVYTCALELPGLSYAERFHYGEILTKPDGGEIVCTIPPIPKEKMATAAFSAKGRLYELGVPVTYLGLKGDDGTAFTGTEDGFPVLSFIAQGPVISAIENQVFQLSGSDTHIFIIQVTDEDSSVADVTLELSINDPNGYVTSSRLMLNGNTVADGRANQVEIVYSPGKFAELGVEKDTITVTIVATDPITGSANSQDTVVFDVEVEATPPASCKAILEAGETVSGLYKIAPCGDQANVMEVWCDMETDGGGWVIMHSMKKSNTGGEWKLREKSSAFNSEGGPLDHNNYRLSWQQKQKISQCSGGNSETLYQRSSSNWFKTNHALYTLYKDSWGGNQETGMSVTATGSSGTTKTVEQGLSSAGSGGDFGVTHRSGGFDHHNSGYYLLNSGCSQHFIYAYGSCGGYKINTAFDGWSSTTGCSSSCGSHTITFYVAQR